MLGPLVARCGRARVALPGGDNIGSRGLDMHIDRADRARAPRCASSTASWWPRCPTGCAGTDLWLDFPSVGATENLLMAAVLAEGTTVIDNVAREPEIIDLCEMLVAMGAQIDGISTSTLTVAGRRPAPAGASTTTVPDRIVAGTWAFAAAIAGGDLTVQRRPARATSTSCWTSSRRPGPRSSDVDGRLPGARSTAGSTSFDVVTLPYPGFPTDLQPFAMALAAVSDGTAMITENVFEARFMFAQELARLGADLRTDGHHAVVRGGPSCPGPRSSPTTSGPGPRWCWPGWPPRAPRRSPSPHIDRGYPYFVEMLAASAPTSAGSTSRTCGP